LQSPHAHHNLEKGVRHLGTPVKVCLEMSRVVWIRSEAFDHAVFNTSVRWTVSKVQEFLASFRTVVSTLVIAQTTWIEVATLRCKPALTEVEANAYWHVFRVLSETVTGQKPAEGLDIRIIGMLLMCQVCNPHRHRSDQFAKTGEMWPGLERATAAPTVSSPRHSPRGSSPRVGASAQSAVSRNHAASSAMLSFVRQQLDSLLEVACTEPAQISSEEFDMLGLILCGGVSLTQPLARLSEALPELAGKKSLPAKEVKKMVENILVWNDQLYSAQENTLGVQAPIGPGMPSTYTVAGQSKTTVFQRPAQGEVDVLSITSCNECTIYITGQARFCLVAGCHDCTIVMAGVSGLCTIHNCEKISIHVAAHCFKMENSIDSSAYLYCHLPPVLTGDTRGIKLAPFNVLYSNMNAVLERANMAFDPEFVDVWAHPVCCTLGAPDETLGGRTGTLDDTNHSTYHFVHPDEFQPVIVPEQGTSPATSSGGKPVLCLPQVYDDALKSREEDMKAFQRLFADITDESKKRRAQQAIQGHFRDWLHSTGRSRQLADLAKLAQQELR